MLKQEISQEKNLQFGDLEKNLIVEVSESLSELRDDNPRIISKNDSLKTEFWIVNDQLKTAEEVLENFHEVKGFSPVVQKEARAAQGKINDVLAYFKLKHINEKEIELDDFQANKLLKDEVEGVILEKLEEILWRKGYKFLMNDGLDYRPAAIEHNAFFVSELRPEKVNDFEYFRNRRPIFLEYAGVKFLEQNGVHEYVQTEHVDLNVKQKKSFNRNMSTLNKILEDCRTIINDGEPKNEEQAKNLAKDPSVRELIENLNQFCPVKFDLEKCSIEGGVNIFRALQVAAQLWETQKAEIVLKVGEDRALQDAWYVFGMYVIHRDRPKYLDSESPVMNGMKKYWLEKRGGLPEMETAEPVARKG